MRNLKRALSLALASVMLLGMMVVGTSAASYPDVDENDNVEAIEVLNAVKVMIGDRGNFRPDAPVNRHEMATIMAKLVLGNETADNYVGTHPFTDVFPWADKYVAACYENGLVSGTSATTFSGNQPLTAVQAAAMMLRALGYKDLSKGATDWRAPVTAMANQIRLFSGVASNPSEQLDRNQVAQLALNTLKSPVVDLKDNTFDVSSGDGAIVITGGSREYIVRSSSESYARAINRTEYQGTSASSVGGYTIELGEHLYNGKLRLEDTTDVFGRPARQWEYDGKAIGAYAKDELLRREYTTKVTGRDLYDLLGKTTIDEYDFYITIDGETEADTLKKGDNSYFTEGNLVRTNTNAIGATDKGVLTQVFVDSNEKDVYIAIINTYLAKASKDYDTKKEEATFTVYGVDDVDTNNPIVLVKDTRDSDSVKSGKQPYTESLKVRNEDIVVEDVKEDDFFLVNVAEGEIKTMVKPEVLSEETINAFKQGSWVNNGSQIDYADTALYDPEVLEMYDDTNMKEVTFNIFLDKYGYMIGLEQNSDPDQYVFITGMDGSNTNLSNRNYDVNAIFMDGTMDTITVNGRDSVWTTDTTEGTGIMNTWCKYSVNSSDVYTLTEVGVSIQNAKAAQTALNVNPAPYSGTRDINRKNLSVATTYTAGTTGEFSTVYGNDDTVFLTVSLDVIKGEYKYEASDSATTQTRNAENRWNNGNTANLQDVAIIDDVDSVAVGVENVSIEVKDVVATDYKIGNVGGTATTLVVPKHEVYALYNDDGYIIASVVIGDDAGSSKSYVYITSGNVNREAYTSADDEWTWTREAVIDGEIGELTYVGSSLRYIGAGATNGNMKSGEWYEVRYDADGNVRRADKLTFANYSASNTKYIDRVEDVESAINNGDTVILQVLLNTTNDKLTLDGGTLYTDAQKTSTKGFWVARDVKTVVGLSKLNTVGQEGVDISHLDNVTDGYEGRDGLEDAIAALDKNFNGYLNVLFDGTGAVTIILDDHWGTKVDEGTDPTPTGKYSSVVDATAAAKITGDPLNLEKAKVDDTNTLILPAHYGQNVKQQLRDALTYLGYKVTGEEYDSTNKVWTFTTEKDGVTGKITCNVTKGTGNIGAAAAEYALINVDGTKSYVAVGDPVTVAAPATNPGTGYIVSTDGGKTFAYGDVYATPYAAATGTDAVIKSGYVKVTVTATATVSGDVTKATVAVDPAVDYVAVNGDLKGTVTIDTVTAGGVTVTVTPAATKGTASAAQSDVVSAAGKVVSFTVTGVDDDTTVSVTIADT